MGLRASPLDYRRDDFRGHSYFFYAISCGVELRKASIALV